MRDRLKSLRCLNKELEKYIYDLKKKDPQGQKRSNAGGWHSPFFNMKDSFVYKKDTKENHIVLL